MDPATTLTNYQIEADLTSLRDEVGDLPWVAQEWPTWSENNQVSYSLEWDNLIGSLKLLTQAYVLGKMTSDQQACYRELLGKLREALPLIEQLKLLHPPVALDAAA